MNISLGDFNAEVRGEVIFNQQLGIKIYMKLVMIMDLRVVNLATSKNSLPKVQCSHIATFQVGKATIKLTIF
jgi:hypothetical protein